MTLQLLGAIVYGQLGMMDFRWIIFLSHIFAFLISHPILLFCNLKSQANVLIIVFTVAFLP